MQNSKAKISIIMPVYNVAEYLPKAIDSILQQTFKDFNLYLVDDGSTDDSGSICDDYSKIDNRVKVIHQSNQGPHNARNKALKQVSSDFVCFFDSDDYIDKNMLNDLYLVAVKNNSDLVISGFYINTYYNDNEFIVLNYIPCISNNSEYECFNNSNEFRKLAYLNFDRNMFYPPWNKLYKTSYLKDNNITFPITYRDDFPFVLSVIKDIKNVTYVKKQYYHFIRKRSESETQKFVPNLYEKREEEHSEMISLYEYWKLIEDSDSYDMISRRYIDRIVECIVNLFNKKCELTRQEKKLLIKKYINSDNFNKSILYAKPKKIYLKIIYSILKTRNIKLCYLMAMMINKIKVNHIVLFSKLKFNR